jgi:hypothetical protein
MQFNNIRSKFNQIIPSKNPCGANIIEDLTENKCKHHCAPEKSCKAWKYCQTTIITNFILFTGLDNRNEKRKWYIKNVTAYIQKKMDTKKYCRQWGLNSNISLGNIVAYHWSIDSILVWKLVWYLLKAKRHQHYEKTSLQDY